MIPYTHDDWEWGTETGLTHLFTADINSRFCGNLIEVILTRNEIIKTVFMALVFVLIPLSITIFASRISGINNNSNKDIVHTVIFLFANLIILLIPADVWAQTNGWVAGFSNFVVFNGFLFHFRCGFPDCRMEESKQKNTYSSLCRTSFRSGIYVQQ